MPPHSLYISLFCCEAVGAAIISLKGIPIYRQLLVGGHEPIPLSDILVWVFIAIALIQGPYWTGQKMFPQLTMRRRAFLGHVIQFVGRFGFLYVGGLFSVIFYSRFQEVDLSPGRVLVLLMALFSMFCWAQEIDRLSKALCEGRLDTTNR